jgi:hypothetical protein
MSPVPSSVDLRAFGLAHDASRYVSSSFSAARFASSYSNRTRATSACDGVAMTPRRRHTLIHNTTGTHKRTTHNAQRTTHLLLVVERHHRLALLFRDGCLAHWRAAALLLQPRRHLGLLVATDTLPDRLRTPDTDSDV